jgi:zinc transport system ATP-binding protein
VLLARALCATRKILLLDEPAAGLDPLASAEMYDLIAKLNQSGTTIIMISHDIAASARHASHVLHIGSGKNSTLFFGTISEYLQSDAGRKYAGLEGEI